LITRMEVMRGWLVLSEALDRQKGQDLAKDIREFVQGMPRVLTGIELLSTGIPERTQADRVGSHGFDVDPPQRE